MTESGDGGVQEPPEPAAPAAPVEGPAAGGDQPAAPAEEPTAAAPGDQPTVPAAEPTVAAAPANGDRQVLLGVDHLQVYFPIKAGVIIANVIWKTKYASSGITTPFENVEAVVVESTPIMKALLSPPTTPLTLPPSVKASE